MSSGDDSTSIQQAMVRYKDFKVVVCVPYGRQDTFEIMKDYLLQSRDCITEVQLWMNTIDQKDMRYAYSLNDQHPDFFKIVEGGSKLKSMDHTSRCRRLKQFYFNCIDQETIYIKMDDDIVYMAPHAIRELLDCRLNNLDSFMIFGNIINNGICNHIHQRIGALDSDPFTVWHAGAGQGWWWENWEGAHVCHSSFLDAYHENPEKAISKYLFPDYTLHAEHMSINCIAWFGEQFEELGDEEWRWIEGADENAFSEWIPAKYGQKNKIAGKALMAHYAYFPQLEGLRKHKNILSQYYRLLHPSVMSDRNADIKSYTGSPPVDIMRRINLIREANIDDLRCVEYLEHELIPKLGLYGGDFIYAPITMAGFCGGLEIWQSPKQLAKYLVYLSDKEIKHYVEIGVARGGNFILLTEYLRRFGLEFAVPLDVYMPEVLLQYRYSTQNALIEPMIGSSQSHRLRKYIKHFVQLKKSLIFIDDRHEFDCCYSNWLAMGQYANICAFHDVNDPLCPGVIRAWQKIKQGRVYSEFFDEYAGVSVKMGIGVIENV